MWPQKKEYLMMVGTGIQLFGGLTLYCTRHRLCNMPTCIILDYGNAMLRLTMAMAGNYGMLRASGFGETMAPGSMMWKGYTSLAIFPGSVYLPGPLLLMPLTRYARFPVNRR